MAANSSQALVRIVEEDSFDTLPSTPDFTEVRLTSESVEHTTDTTNSGEVRSDRQVSDVIRTSVGASGDISFELSHGSFDNGANAIDLIGGALANNWNSALSISGTIGVDATNSQFTSDTGTSTADFSNVVVGQWILTAGFSTASNNDYWRVTSVDTSSTTHTITVDDPDSNLTDETGDGDETVSGTAIFNGTTFRSFAIEKEFTDISKFDLFKGMVVNSMSLDASSQSQITGSFSFTGKRGESSVTSSQAASTTAASTTQVMNTVDHVGRIRENQSSLTIDVDSISFSLENNVFPLVPVGNVGATDIGLGRFGATGNFNVFFSDRTILDRYRDFTETSLSFKTEDSNGNAYIWDFPAINFTSGPVVIEGNDSFVLANFGWSAKVDGNVGQTISVTKF